MLSPRWHKVLRDLWGTKARTLLVALSIGIGIFAVGMVSQTFATVQGQLKVEYPKTHPAHAILYTDPFDDDLLRMVRHMDGVAYAEGRTSTGAKIRVGPDQWKSISITTIPDFNTINIDKISPQRTFADPKIGAERGVWPPPERGMLLERSSFQVPGLVPPDLKVGDSVEIEMSNGKRYQLQFSGLAREPSRLPAALSNAASAYITPDTLYWLTGTRQVDELSIRVSQEKPTKEQVTLVANQVRNKIENSGAPVYLMQVPEPDRHPLEPIFQALLLLLNALGFAALFLSGFLIVNTVSALMGQQVRQIGMMKAVGARQGQIVGMYMIVVLTYGVLAFLIAAPLAAYVSGITSNLMAQWLANVDLPGDVLMPDVLVTEAAIALIFPLVAGFIPVVNGTRLTVREAIADYGLGRGVLKVGLIDRLFAKVRGVSRPVLLSLRNTVRRKGRLALTLTTLILGGAIFIGVFNIHAALLVTLEDVLKYWQFDILEQFNRAYRFDLLQQEVMKVPGVVQAEGWGLANSRRVRADDSESDNILVFAPPADTKMLQPLVIKGRWLLPDDEDAIVLSSGVANTEKDIKVGDTITLKTNGKKSDWQVVGVVRLVGQLGAGIGPAYTNYPYFARTVGGVEHAGAVPIVTEGHDAAYQEQIKTAVEAQFKAAGIRTAGALTTGQIRQANELQFNILVGMLMTMAILMMVVGGLGLMGTMSLNVLERTREIGIMRAIGASNGAVRSIVMIEGMLIGLVSWLVGTLLSIPLGQLLSDALGAALELPLHYAVSTDGIVIWFIVVVAISALSTILPAQNASRLTVREVLAYE